MQYNSKELAKFKLGAVVEIYEIPNKFGFRGKAVSVGHVTGLSLNPLEEVIVLVDDCKGMTKPYHTSRLLVLE